VSLREEPAWIDAELEGGITSPTRSFDYVEATGRFRVESTREREDRQQKEQTEKRVRQFWLAQFLQGRNVPTEWFMPPGTKLTEPHSAPSVLPVKKVTAKS
ncbi:MAG: hypothetical protein K1X57_22990, partial [Gemmataceae bacterium]|nr:hypothetical protein [Gemmataceae bacterium]